MKNPVIKEEQRFYLCCICHKRTTEIYGRWGEIGGTCSKKCEEEKESQPKLHGGKPCTQP